MGNQAVITEQQSLADLHGLPRPVPRVGDYWEGQGGHYAGIMRDAKTGEQWHLILVDHPGFKSPWGKYGTLIEGEFSRIDGTTNTALILQQDPENKIAKAIRELEAEGHTDCYWPAEYENNLICANLPDLVEPIWHWSSTQYSSSYAWFQTFADGSQTVYGKYEVLAVRAVRRLLIR